MAKSGDVNGIALTQHDPGEGWGHGVWFGTDVERGWVLECDMEGGGLVSAFTPAGRDALFLMQAKPAGAEAYAGGVVTIEVQTDAVAWDAAARRLTIRDAVPEPEEEAPAEGAPLRADREVVDYLARLLADVEGEHAGFASYAMHIENPEHPWHETIMAGRALLARLGVS